MSGIATYVYDDGGSVAMRASGREDALAHTLAKEAEAVHWSDEATEPMDMTLYLRKEGELVEVGSYEWNKRVLQLEGRG